MIYCSSHSTVAVLHHVSGDSVGVMIDMSSARLRPSTKVLKS